MSVTGNPWPAPCGLEPAHLTEVRGHVGTTLPRCLRAVHLCLWANEGRGKGRFRTLRNSQGGTSVVLLAAVILWDLGWVYLI